MFATSSGRHRNSLLARQAVQHGRQQANSTHEGSSGHDLAGPGTPAIPPVKPVLHPPCKIADRLRQTLLAEQCSRLIQAGNDNSGQPRSASVWRHPPALMMPPHVGVRTNCRPFAGTRPNRTGDGVPRSLNRRMGRRCKPFGSCAQLLLSVFRPRRRSSRRYHGRRWDCPMREHLNPSMSVLVRAAPG